MQQNSLFLFCLINLISSVGPELLITSLLFTDAIIGDYRGDAILELPIAANTLLAAIDKKEENVSRMENEPVRVAIPPIPQRSIRSLASDPRTRTTYSLSTLPNIDSFGVVYASNNSLSSIMHMHGHNIRRFALDWITGNIYYVVDGAGIGVCSQKTCGPPIIAPSTSNNIPVIVQSVALYPPRGRIFWSEWDSTNNRARLMSAGMQGQSITQMGDDLNEMVDDLFVDYWQDTLYFITPTGVFHRTNLSGLVAAAADDNNNGDDIEVIPVKWAPLMAESRQLRNVKSLVALDEFFYYFNSTTAELTRLKREANGKIAKFRPEPLAQLNTFDSMLAINDPSVIDHFANPCEAKNCSDICLLKPSDNSSQPLAVCACRPPRINSPHGECIKAEHIKELLDWKVKSKSVDVVRELNEHRDRMEAGGLGITWALIFTSAPTTVIVLILCGTLIYVIVNDYIEYVKIINE